MILKEDAKVCFRQRLSWTMMMDLAKLDDETLRALLGRPTKWDEGRSPATENSRRVVEVQFSGASIGLTETEVLNGVNGDVEAERVGLKQNIDEGLKVETSTATMRVVVLETPKVETSTATMMRVVGETPKVDTSAAAAATTIQDGRKVKPAVLTSSWKGSGVIG